MRCKHLLFFYFLGSFALAEQPYYHSFGIRPMALGGAFRAVASGNDGIHYNPASIVLPKRFSADLNYLYQTASNRHWAGLSLVDSITSIVAAGVDYHLGILQAEHLQLTHIGALALAIPIVEDFLSFGGTLKYLHFPEIPSDAGMSQFSADLGATAYLPFGISVAAVGHNLLPNRNRRAPLALGIGSAFQSGLLGAESSNLQRESGLTLAADWVFQDNPNGLSNHLSTGAEYVVAGVVPIRAGYTWYKEENQHLASAGIGILTQMASIEAMYQQNILNAKEQSFGVAIKVFF